MTLTKTHQQQSENTTQTAGTPIWFVFLFFQSDHCFFFFFFFIYLVKLLEEANKKFELALQLQPNQSRALKNYGVSLSKLARLKESEPLFETASKQFEKCILLKPKDHEVYFNWANLYYRMAKIKVKKYSQTYKQNSKQKQELLSLLKEAAKKYEMTVELQPSFHGPLNNWTKVLGKKKNNNKGSIYVCNFLFFKLDMMASIEESENSDFLNSQCDLFLKSFEFVASQLEECGFKPLLVLLRWKRRRIVKHVFLLLFKLLKSNLEVRDQARTILSTLTTSKFEKRKLNENKNLTKNDST